MKNKNTAALLAFFLGGIGIHRFYLRQPILGLIYLGFCWTYIPLVIAFIDFLIIAIMSDEKFNFKYNKIQPSDKKNRETLIKEVLSEIKISTSYTSSKENSIIDVTGNSYKINSYNVQDELQKYDKRIPYWSHQYVYSFSELKGATPEQVNFYNLYKANFLQGKYLDIEGNNNYAFILLFDLLNEYDNHKNIAKLKEQLVNLGKHYPKTKSYGISFLIEKMQAVGDTTGIEELRHTESGHYYFRQEYYTPLGTKYRKNLKLKDSEAKLLDKLNTPNNNFCNIEYCLLEVLKIYLTTIDRLTERYIEEGSSLDDQFKVVADLIARKHFKYRLNSTNYKYCIESSITELHSTVFRHCENAIREYYGHKRKVNIENSYNNEVKNALELNILSKVKEILPLLLPTVKLPDEDTELALNAQNTNRWKSEFEKLTTDIKNSDGKKFIEAIKRLGELNKQNPSVEMIFFEASKFIAKTDKESALLLYIYYIFYDLNSATFDNRQLTKTIQKSLFKTNDQLQDFELIVGELIKDRNLEKALQTVTKIYAPKRKKIKLDTSAIKEVHQKHSGTVELLNEYLKDDSEEESTLKVEEESIEEVEIDIAQETNQTDKFVSSIGLNDIQAEVLDVFAKSSFVVSQSELESFAKAKGLFKNQLIESINDTCFETIDDLLIEEEDDNYIMNEKYYQQIFENDRQY